MNYKIFSFVFLIAATVLAFYLNSDLIGKAPEQQKAERSVEEKLKTFFPELNVYREELVETKEPTARMDLLETYAEVLKAKVQVTQHQELTYEFVSVLTEMLKLEAENTYALIELANISFESKIFSKAASYYQRYLLQEPTDLFARTRYASALIFVNQNDLADYELKQVLALRPNDFSALAYLAILQAQTGEIELAKTTADLAIINAPDDAGRDRLRKFIVSLNNQEAGAQPVVVAIDSENYLDYLKTNDITRDKFVREETSGSTLKLLFKDFPVSQMPDFARKKFIGSLVSGLPKEIATIELIDQASSEIMLSIPVEK